MIHALYRGYIPAGALVTQAFAFARESRLRADNYIMQCRNRTARKLLHLRQRARRRGYQAGCAAARRDLAQKTLELQAQYYKLLQSTNEECLALALLVAEEVIGKAMESSGSYLGSRVEKLLAPLYGNATCTVLVNPADLAEVQAFFKSDEWVTVVGDLGISRGDATIKSPFGCVELNWHNHLVSLADHLRQELQQKQVGSGDASS